MGHETAGLRPARALNRSNDHLPKLNYGLNSREKMVMFISVIKD